MNIKKRFIISNIVMLVTPIFLIGVITIVFLALFIFAYPSYNMNGISQLDLLKPRMLVQSLGELFENNPGAIRYVYLWSVLSVAIIVGVITGITVVLSRRVLRPIRELTKAANNIKDGNLNFEVMRASDEEIDELCRVFDEMRGKLKMGEEMQREHVKERKMLLANISHDLKTPITSIKGYIEGIRDGVADTPEKMNRYLETIYAKANAIDEMVNNLSMYSKLELDKLQFDFELGDINEFIRQITEEYKLDLQKNNMRLRVNLSEEKAIVKIDYKKMHRVFSNLIDNAIKYKKDGEGLICISTEISGSGVFVKISDYGIGIHEDELGRVFEGFYRGDPSRNMNIKGNGLGLGIARQIVENHGGKIWLKSGETQGTVAFVYLPLRKEKGYGENINY